MEVLITKEQRLKRYKIAIKYLKKKETAFTLKGFCIALSNGIVFDTYYPRNDAAMENMYPELYVYKPKRGWKKDSRFWWSPKDKKAIQRRINILEKIIKEME